MSPDPSNGRNSADGFGADSAASGDAAPTTPSYEQARAELVEIVRTLEQGGGTLEESVSLWERGEELARICESWLDGARERLDAAIRDETAGSADR